MIQVEYSDIETVANCMLTEVDIRPGYSGRGMYGDQCLGIVTNIQGFAQFVQVLVQQVTENELDGRGDTLAEFRDCIDRVSFDSMGLSMIFYWPEVQVKGSNDAGGQVRQGTDRPPGATRWPSSATASTE